MPKSSAKSPSAKTTGAANGPVRKAVAKQDKAAAEEQRQDTLAAPAVVEAPPARKILYDRVEAAVCDGPDAINVATMKRILGWETERDYIARKVKAAEDKARTAGIKNPKIGGEQFAFGSNYLLIDDNGDKIRCWNNNRNRPFVDATARAYAQVLLKRHWAGPLSMPGETVNGESFIIGNTGQVISGQHRGAGLILAYQMWLKDAKWKKYWPTEPVLETVLVTGVSESAQVVQTIDNVRPRSLGDIFYTGDLFQDKSPAEKKECARMLAKAVDLAFLRTGASAATNGESHYQTHDESTDFLNRHGRLLDCLTHIFDCNKDRVLSKLRLSPGYSTAALYLMGSAASNPDKYMTADRRSEELLDWSLEEKAKSFFSDLGKGNNAEHLKAVNVVLGRLIDEDNSRMTEKLLIQAKAWRLFAEDQPVDEDAIEVVPTMVNGVATLTDYTTFGGIDLGPKKPKGGKNAPSPEQIQAERDAIKKENLAKLANKK